MSTQFHAKNSSTLSALNSFPYQYQYVSQSIERLKQYCQDHIENGKLPTMDEHGNHLLHLLASDGKDLEISELGKDGLLKADYLRVGNSAGDTPLHQAARFGKKNVADVLFKVVAGDHARERERELCSAPNSWDETPAYLAAAYGWEDMFEFLKGKLDRDVMLRGRKDGWTMLHALVMAEHYDFALKIVEEYPELADRPDKEGMTALHMLASKPQTFRSGTKYTLINLGLGTFIPLQLIEILVYNCAPSGNWEVKSSSAPNFISTLFSALSSGYAKISTPLFTACPVIKDVYDIKKKHGYAELLAEKLIKGTKAWMPPSIFEEKNSWDTSPSDVEMRARKRNTNYVPSGLDYHPKAVSLIKKRAPSNPLLEAARNMIIELVRLFVENSPDVANAMVDQDGKNVLHVVAESKNIYLYEYLMKSKVVKWDMLRLAVDRFGNTIWHHAASCGTGPKVLFGPGNFMAWDTLWFKLVRRDCDPYLQEHRNSSGFTAMELYMENHKSLREDASKAAKDMNQGLMLVTALIGTVNYSALMALPGGYNQDNGQPLFRQRGDLIRKDLLIFMIYVAFALLTTIFSLGTQLAIQLSRFLPEDYFYSLPFKYILAMTSLFYAANFTVLACVQVFVLQGILKTRWFTFFWWPCVCSVLIYIDSMYLTFNHFYFLYLFFCTNKHDRQMSNRGVSKYLY